MVEFINLIPEYIGWALVGAFCVIDTALATIIVAKTIAANKKEKDVKQTSFS